MLPAMQLIARKSIGGGKCCNLAPNLVLLAFQTLGFSFVRSQLFQVGFNECRDRRITLSSCDSGSPIDIIVNRNCDIAHIFTVSQP